MRPGNINECFQSFASQWPVDGTYYIWGTSNTARELRALFQDQLNIVGYIDNASEKWGTQFLGRPVLSPEEFYSQKGDTQCIIASKAFGEIGQELKQHGINEDTEFCVCHKFIGIHQYLKQGQLFQLRATMSITSCCTLRCRHCCFNVPYHKDQRHRLADRVLTDVDTYFQWVDHVTQFNLMGGEPFIHPNVDDITEKIAERYRSRMDQFLFITNGTVMPSQRMLELMMQYKIEVEISDYHKGVPKILPKVEALERVLREHEISCHLTPNDTWIDWSYIPEDRTKWNDKQMTEFCKTCGTCCQGVYEQKMYYCYQQVGAVLAEICPEEPSDYYSLTGPVNAARKAELLAFCLDCAPKGYESYCRKCAGWRAVNPRIVPAGEQLPPEYADGRP